MDCSLPGSSVHGIFQARVLAWGAIAFSARVLCKGTDSVGRAFSALPRSEQLRRPGAWREDCPRWTMHLNYLSNLAAQFPRCATRAPSLVCRISPLGSWSQAATLLADVNHLGSQEDFVSNREPAHSVVEDAGLWGRECPLPSGSGCRLPVSLPPVGGGACTQPTSSPIHSILCSVRAPGCVLGNSLLWESSLIFLSGYPTVWDVISCLLPQVVLRAFRPCPYSKHWWCSPCLAAQPQLAGDRWERLGYFSAGGCS